MEKKPFPSEALERFIVRLPDGMRDRIAEAAATNNRSMNSEIVARLTESFDGKTVRLPDAIAERLQRDAAEHGWEFQSELLHLLVDAIADRDNPPAKPAQATSGDTLYILLDAHGYPMSWGEIGAYLDSVKERGGIDDAELHATIVTPDMESNSRRAAEAMKLAETLRTGGKSRVVRAPKSAAQPAARRVKSKK